MPRIPAKYVPSEHESRIIAAWNASRAFHADPKRVVSGEAEPYCVLIPPPNVTAALHLGHALNNTLQDVLVRAARMQGKETLWMPGTDHAGIATQTVVEKRVQKEEGRRRAVDFPGEEGRKEFVAKIQAFKDEYEATITGQLVAMGCSCDWERQRFTMDSVCARAVREAFFLLFKDGLIERGKRLVNWDPVTQTALADDEVEMEEVDGNFYYLRYPLVRAATGGTGVASGGSSISGGTGVPPVIPATWGELARAGYPGADQHEARAQAWITVATTRPETYLGDTAVAINPKDPRASALRGMCVQLPIVGRVIPILEDNYVVMPAALGGDASDPKAAFATGFLKVTPAHDPNDYELGQRHRAAIESLGIPWLINVMGPDASISDRHGWTLDGDNEAKKLFVGKSREAARKQVIIEFKRRRVSGGTIAAGENTPPDLLCEAVKPYRHSVGHSYRSHAAIEPYLSDQWYVKVDKKSERLGGKTLKELTLEALRGGTALRAVQGSDALGGTALRAVHSVLDMAVMPPIIPPGFVGRDPYPKGQSSPGDLMGFIRNLPHIELEGATYFVTWRTAPGRTLGADARSMVLEGLRHWDATRCDMYAACVMPDHVHAIVRPFQGESISELVGGIKKFTALSINRSQGTSGHLWQDERFDHVLRDGAYFTKFLRYVVDNPVEEGLATRPSEYPFTIVHGEVLRILEDWDHKHRSESGATTSQGIEHRSASGPTTSQGIEHRSASGPTTSQGIEHRSESGATQGIGSMHCSESGATKDNDPATCLSFHPERYAKTYQNWNENLRDWCISRQLWWGHRIPVWFVADNNLTSEQASIGEYLADWEKEGRVVVQERGTFGKVTNSIFEGVEGIGNHFICVRSPEDRYVIDILEANGTWVQDPDVLDTWFSSALWPLSTLGWPDPAQAARDTGISDFADLLGAFNPSNVLCTAREIITLWVSRMVMFNRYFLASGCTEQSAPTDAQAGRPCHQAAEAQAGRPCHRSDAGGPVPFHDVFIHAMIQDGQGRKMSKSLGNGVDPLDIIATHGADAMRFVLCQMATHTQDVRMPVEKDERTGRNTSPKFDLGRNFCTKLWNAARFTMMQLEESVASPDAAGARGAFNASELSLVDRWIVARLASTIGRCEQALRDYQFSAYATALYDLLWRDFCDWYLEAVKPTAKQTPVQQAVLRAVIDGILRLLHPVAPFITEAIWDEFRTHQRPAIEGLGLNDGASKNGAMLCRAAWPTASPALGDEVVEARFARIQAFTGAIREARSVKQIEPKRRLTLHVGAEMARELQGAEAIVRSLAGLEAITTDAAPVSGCAVFTFEAVSYSLSGLGEAADAQSEIESLKTALAKLDKDISVLEGRLNNPGYADKAPAKMVQQSREQLAQKQSEREAIRARLAASA